MIALNVWGFFIHANVRWRFGPFERLLATPAFHHWHHTASGVPDCNFASMLPIWDMLFGTWYLPAAWTPSYGIRERLPATVAGQLLYPLLPHDFASGARDAMLGEPAKGPGIPPTAA